MPGQGTLGFPGQNGVQNPEQVQDNVSVVYVGKVNGKIFTKTKDSKTYALVSPSLYKRIPKLDSSASALPMDGGGAGPMNGATGPGNINGLPSMVGGPNRTPTNR